MRDVDEIRLLPEGAEWNLNPGDGVAGRLRLTRPLSNAWRLQFAPGDAAFVSRGACQTLTEQLGETPAEINRTLCLDKTTGGSPAVQEEGTTGRAEIGDGTGECRFVDDAGREVAMQVGTGPGGISLSVPLRDGERLWGTGERFNQLDQRGKRLELWAVDHWCRTEGNSYVPIPFVLSSLGYGLLVNSFEGMVFDLGATDAGRWTVEDLNAPLDVYIFLGPTPLRIVETLTALTGRPPMPPDWSFGMLVSRHGRIKEFGTSEGVLEMADTMDRLDLPWSGAIIEGWPTYDKSRYGELRKLVHDLHARDKKVMVYDACGRVEDKLTGRVDTLRDMLVRQADGNVDLAEASSYNPADAPDRRHSRFVDLTRPEAVAWWQDDVWGPLLNDIQVDGAKIDFCEQFPEHKDLVLAGGCVPKGMHHLYPTLYNTMMHRLFNERRPDGGLCWSRGGGIGAGRYPFMWCGDQLREFDFLRAMLLAALSSGLCGIPFMGHDMSGYLPTSDLDTNPEPEIFVRGTQMAAFWPMMSTHGTVTRPYDFEPPIVDLYRTWTKAHYALIPYIREQSRLSCETGVPFLRALCLHAPDDPSACGVEDEFLMGSDILVAPVFERAETRDVYLPAGAWRDMNSGTRFTGPAVLKGHPAPFETIPFFVTDTPTSEVVDECLDQVAELIGR